MAQWIGEKDEWDEFFKRLGIGILGGWDRTSRTDRACLMVKEQLGHLVKHQRKKKVQ